MEGILKNFDLVPFDLVMIACGAFAFVAFWKVLEVKFFKPYLTLLEAREALTSGADGNAKELRTKAASLTDEYERQILAARIAAMEKKLSAVDAAKKQANDTFDKSVLEAKQLIEAERAKLTANRSQARTEALNQAKGLVEDLVQKLKQPRQVMH